MRRVLYLVISGAPAPEGVPALISACQAAGWRVVCSPPRSGPGSSILPSWSG